LKRFEKVDERDCSLYKIAEGFTVKTKAGDKSLFVKMDFDKILPKITFDCHNLNAN
jgi:hypothetical protein